MQKSLTRGEWLVVTTAILASGMGFLDNTVVNIAVPTLQRYFGSDLGTVLWAVSAFTLVEACVLLISGSLSDRFGRKKFFMIGVALFIFSSVLCGVAPSVGILIFFRALQGVGSGMLIPGSLSLISINTAKGRRNYAIGLWSGIAGVFGIAGPFIGGFIVEHFSWRAIFFLNLPLGILVLLLAYFFIPESKSSTKGAVDWRGAILIFFGLGGISYSLMSVPRLGWGSAQIVASLVVGTVLVMYFIYLQSKVKNPLLELSIFKVPLVAGANLITFLLYFALNSTFFFLMLNLQELQGFAPSLAGLAILPAVLLITLLSGAGGTFADRVGPRIPLILGPVLFAVGVLLLMTVGPHANYLTTFLPALVFFGLGMSLIIAPVTNSALSVPERYAGAASGANNAITGVAALLAVALLGALVVPLFENNLRAQVSGSTLTLQEQTRILDQSAKFGAIDIPKDFSLEAYATARGSIENSFTTSFRVMMAIDTLLALLSAFVAAIFIKKQKSSRASN